MPSRPSADEGLRPFVLSDERGVVVWHETLDRDQACLTGRHSVSAEFAFVVPREPDVRKQRLLWASDGPRERLLTLAAEWAAWLYQTLGVPLMWSQGRTPGHTSHWNVTQSFHAGDGPTDCWPVHQGGYWPALHVLAKARQIVEA